MVWWALLQRQTSACHMLETQSQDFHFRYWGRSCSFNSFNLGFKRSYFKILMNSLRSCQVNSLWLHIWICSCCLKNKFSFRNSTMEVNLLSIMNSCLNLLIQDKGVQPSSYWRELMKTCLLIQNLHCHLFRL